MKVFFALCLLSQPLLSQETLPELPAIPDSENLVHGRHTAARNKKHATVAATEDRFFTNRTGAALALTNEEPMFSFAVFGDRTGGPADGVNILADAVRDVNLHEPDMVLTVGDLINGYNTTEGWLPQMKEYKGVMENLTCPWFPVAGNHDVYWRGPDSPAKEHEDHYEHYFGPLWYAFEHKECFFIVLYSDEGNPETGERNFHKPESQRMSPDQFAWLKETLAKAKDAKHVFLFLHHPRWIGNNYGDDWERVHAELVKAGNVTAVFAGHIHYMRSDPRDGIQYVVLGTTGGHNPGTLPTAGYRHHYNFVTVRESQIAITTYPVGAALDPLDLTPSLINELQGLAKAPVEMSPSLALAADGEVNQDLTITLKNPTSRPMELDLTFPCDDNRWTVLPSHSHLKIPAGEVAEATFRIGRQGNSLDDFFDLPTLAIDSELLTQTSRYPLLTRQLVLPFDFSELEAETEDSALDFNGRDQFLSVPSEKVPVANELTLEAWFQARAYGSRTGLVTKAENSDYGIFVNKGRPNFIIFIGDSYLEVGAPKAILQTGQWHHVAGVYDGEEARLYLDGQLVASEKRRGKRRTNNFPLVIAADTGHRGANSHFDGLIDSVRLSAAARYHGVQFEPVTKFTPDEDTVGLYEMDLHFGNLSYDSSGRGNHASASGAPTKVAR